MTYDLGSSSSTSSSTSNSICRMSRCQMWCGSFFQFFCYDIRKYSI